MDCEKDSTTEAAKNRVKLNEVYLKAGDRVDINVGYFTADKTGWYRIGENGMELIDE